MKKNFGELFSLKGKTAIVTGGAGMLGRCFCAGLAEFGARVAVVDIDGNKAETYAKELRRRYGVKSIGVACDVSNPASVRAMLAETVKAFGSVHVLHNNAATKNRNLNSFFKSFEECSLSEWREVMRVNLDGMFLVAQAAGRQMAEQGSGGSIIQTASIYGMLGPDARIYEGSHYLGGKINTPAVYSASKGGVLALTKYLAAYWAKKKIRVNTLTPGGVESGQNSRFRKNYSNRVPLGRMAKADEMVGALIYLASAASSYVTGQNIIVDGGLSTW